MAQWQWRGTLYSPKLQHYWNLTIRLFSIISRTLVGVGVSYPSGEKQLVYSTALTDKQKEPRENANVFENNTSKNVSIFLGAYSYNFFHNYILYINSCCVYRSNSIYYHLHFFYLVNSSLLTRSPSIYWYRFHKLFTCVLLTIYCILVFAFLLFFRVSLSSFVKYSSDNTCFCFFSWKVSWVRQ